MTEQPCNRCCCTGDRDPVQELQQFGISVEDHPELRHVLEKHPDLVPLLRGAARFLHHRLPRVALHLEWYCDPEIPEDTYPLILVRLPSYEDEAEIRSLISAVEDANMILSVASHWVMAMADFHTGVASVSRLLRDAIHDAVLELLALQLELLRGEVTEEQGWQWLIDFFESASAEALVLAREQGMLS